MRSPVLAAAVLAAAVTSAGCASSASDDAATSGSAATTTATTGNGVAVGEPSPGNAASALQRFGVRREELPADFRVATAGVNKATSTGVDDALQRCAGADPAPSVAGATSAIYATSYARVSSTTERFTAASDVTDAVAVLQARDAERCFGRWFAAQRPALTNEQSAPSASSVTVRPGTNDGPRNEAGIVSASYRFRGNGSAYPVSVGVYYFTGPSIVTRLIVTEFGGDAFDRSLNKVLFAVAARTAAG